MAGGIMDYKLFDLRHNLSTSVSYDVEEDMSLTDRIVPHIKSISRWNLKSQPELDDNVNACRRDRAEWYSLISHDSFGPAIRDSKLVFFVDADQDRDSSVTMVTRQRLEQALQKNLDSLKISERAEKEEKLLSSLSEFCRYMPDIDRPDANFFIDSDAGGVGVTIKRNGTLSLLVHTKGAVDFSYASKAKFGGLVRITGTAKFTANNKNSEHVKSLLDFLGEE
jgi:hypothetical protein